MKRTAMMIAAAALACTVGATGVWAVGPGRSCLNQACTKARCLFTDENNDGLCNHYTDGSCHRKDACYTDENGDGICDNRADGGCHGGGYGYGARMRACQP